MGAESEIIEHTVTIADAVVTREGFGIPLIALYHNYWAERVRAFESPDDMTLAPFNVPTTSVLYATARAIKSAASAPPAFKVGKLTGPVTQSVELTPSTPTAGAVYSLTIDGAAVSVTADGTPTVAEVTAALATAISAVLDVTGVDGTTKVTVNGDTAGVMHAIEALSSNLKLKDVTALPSPTPTTDLAAIQAADGDWYALLLATGGKASVEDAAAWAEAQQHVLFIAQTSDSGAIDGAVTTDVISDLKTAGYQRTGILYHERTVSQAPAAAWAGVMLPKLPGPATWANKRLAGVDMSAIDATARSALTAKNGNYYIPIKSTGFTLHGKAAGGRFLDVTVAIDWFDVGVEDRIILLMANNDVVPYTDKGIDLVRGQVLGQILEGISLGIIDGEQPYSVSVPTVSAVDPADKADRLLARVQYAYVLSGAIHKVKIVGTVKV
jgi:Protein of unknown function (DUF3383)